MNDDDQFFFIPEQIEEWRQLFLPMNVDPPDYSWTWQEMEGDLTSAIARERDEHFWPHKKGCPACGSDAYVGFARVECSNGGCQNWFHREGM